MTRAENPNTSTSVSNMITMTQYYRLTRLQRLEGVDVRGAVKGRYGCELIELRRDLAEGLWLELKQAIPASPPPPAEKTAQAAPVARETAVQQPFGRRL